MQWEVAFDLLETGYRGWNFALYGLFLVVISLIFVFFRGAIAMIHAGFWFGRKGPPKIYKIFVSFFCWSFLLISVFWTILAFTITYLNFAPLKTAYLSGKYTETEGYIENFRATPYHVDQKERFTVNGYTFEYSDTLINGGFNNTRSRGGPLREGLYVKIWHVDGVIIGLKIRR